MLNFKTYLVFLLLILLFTTNSFWYAVRSGSSEASKERDTVRITQRVVVPPDTVFRISRAIVRYKTKTDTVYVEKLDKSESDSSAVSELPSGTCEAGTLESSTDGLAFLAVDTLRNKRVNVYSEFYYPELLFKTRVELKLDTIFVDVLVECPKVNELTFFEEIWLDYGLPVFGGVLIFAILAS